MRHFRRMFGQIVGCIVLCTGTPAMAQFPGILAQAEPEEQNFLVWLIQCEGLFGLLAMLAGVAIFFGSWIVVFAARRPAVIASYLVFLLLPLLLAMTGALKGLVSTFSVVAMSETDLKQSLITGLLAEVLVLPLTALILTIPSFLVIAVGLFIRTLKDKRPESGVQKGQSTL